jgi:hypothetical protein
MAVNNYETIKKMVKFDTDDDYYFLQIIKRRKDNPDMEKDAVHISDYYLTEKNFDNCIPEIVSICDALNARAYLRINRRSFKKSALESLQLIVANIVSEDHKAVRKAFASSSGRCHSDPDKKWIIDLDKSPSDFYGEFSIRVNKVHNKVKELISITGRDTDCQILETKNGLHIVCRPFNLHEFRKEFDCDVHKDNMVILYCP